MGRKKKRKKYLYEKILDNLLFAKIYVLCDKVSFSMHESKRGLSFSGPILIVGKLLAHDNICIALEVEDINYPSPSANYLGFDRLYYLNIDEIKQGKGFLVIRKSEIKMFGACYEDAPYDTVFLDLEEKSAEEYLPELEEEEKEED